MEGSSVECKIIIAKSAPACMSPVPVMSESFIFKKPPCAKAKLVSSVNLQL